MSSFYGSGKKIASSLNDVTFIEQEAPVKKTKPKLLTKKKSCYNGHALGDLIACFLNKFFSLSLMNYGKCLPSVWNLSEYPPPSSIMVDMNIMNIYDVPWQNAGLDRIPAMIAL